MSAQAADFSATLLGGEFFFNIVDEDAATCEFAANPNGPYNITLTGAWLPTTVNYNGKDYTIIGVGVEAFKDGYVTNGADNNTAKQREFWGFPTTLQYVRADAFNGFRSNFPALLRGNVTEFDVTAMRNNKINAINTAGQEGTYLSVSQVQGYKVNTNNDTYSATSALEASAGSIIYKELDGGGKVLVAYPGDHRRTYHHYYQSGVTLFPLDDLYDQIITVVDATGYVEIGENAFYGNENVTQVNFDQALTTIGAHAFENSVLTTLTLPATIETIGEDAFKNVTTLTSITCNAVTPPAVVFDDAVYAAISESGNITVPEEALAAYQADENWGRFWTAPPAPTVYTITVADGIENGTVEVDKTEAAEGETVTITATPVDRSYRVKSITVAPETLNLAVMVDENGQFTMPADNVTVSAEFELIPPVESVITFEAAPENGAVAVYVNEAQIESGTAVAEGTVVTVVLTPTDGYKVESFSVETAENVEPDGPTGLPRRASVPVNGGENNTYSFEMPAEPVTLNASFVQDTSTAITDVRADGVVRYIDVTGRVSDKPFQGINIVVNADGTVTKMVK